MMAKTGFIFTLIVLMNMIGTVYPFVMCTACRGIINSECHLRPEDVAIKLNCSERCTVFGKIYWEGKQLQQIVRDCGSRIFPTPIQPEWENKCKDDNVHFIECTQSCSDADYCSDNITWAPPGWNLDGSKVVTAGRNNGVSLPVTFSFIFLVGLIITNIY